MSVLLKELGKQTGLIRRLVCVPWIVCSWHVDGCCSQGVLVVVEDLDDEELLSLVAEIQND